MGSKRLLVAGDPSPAVVENPGGSSPFLLIGDHAGRAIPAALDGLGVPAAEMERHIAWDIGVAGMGAKLALALDACFIRQAYSRLVIDCNRMADASDLVPEISDGTVISGNIGLSEDDIAVRVSEIAQPYQDAIAAELGRRAAAGRIGPLVSLHSFTPVMRGIARPWRIGVLHRNDSELSRRMLILLRAELGDEVGDNQPYRMDGTDNTVPLHVDPRGLDYVELEVRQDLIADDVGQAWAAELIGRMLTRA
jgi:predicted N-formylglutamate amidohydrolase